MFLAMLVATAAASWSVDPLPSWRDGVAKQRIFDFVANVTQPGPNYLAPADRIVVIDDDGTLWDQPMPLPAALAEDPIRDPVTGRRYTDLVYAPMSEMLAFLRASGFTVYLVAGDDADAIRPWASETFDISPGRVVASRASIEGQPIMAFVSSDAGLGLLAEGSHARLGVVVEHTDDAAQTVQLAEDAPAHGWLVVDVARDWRRRFAAPPWPEH